MKVLGLFGKKKQRLPLETASPSGGKILTTRELAAEARSALTNTALLTAFADLEREATQLWWNTGTLDVTTREFLWHHLKALRQVKGRIEKYLREANFEERLAELRATNEGPEIKTPTGAI